jgi:hypothetical protein
MKFGSGVRVRELLSIALVIAQFASLEPPSRREKRNCEKLVSWYRRNWTEVTAWFPVVHLLDTENRPIDGGREFVDKLLI